MIRGDCGKSNSYQPFPLPLPPTSLPCPLLYPCIKRSLLPHLTALRIWSFLKSASDSPKRLLWIYIYPVIYLNRAYIFCKNARARDEFRLWDPHIRGWNACVFAELPPTIFFFSKINGSRVTRSSRILWRNWECFVWRPNVTESTTYNVQYVDFKYNACLIVI